MLPKEYITKQDPERQKLLQDIHDIISKTDKSISAMVQPMMGKEMIVYNAPGMFKYGLSSVKGYMSLHVMPIYASPVLYNKYKNLLKKAKFQKGCINFKNEEEMPLDIVQQLITDCAKIDLAKVKEQYMKSKKA